MSSALLAILRGNRCNSDDTSLFKNDIPFIKRVETLSWIASTSEKSAHDALDFVTNVEKISLSDYCVVGEYVRYDEDTRNLLKDLKRKIISGLQLEDGGQEVYLIWGLPGSGKSYFPQELAKSLGTNVSYIPLNFAKQDEKEFRDNAIKLRLKLNQTNQNDKQALLCLMDEIDSKPILEASRLPPVDSTEATHKDSDQAIVESGVWSYDSLCPLLWPEKPRSFRTCFILTGSYGSNVKAMINLIKTRLKGVDVISRIPNDHQCSIPLLNAKDKIVVFLSNLMVAAKMLRIHIREVDRLLLLYVALNPQISNARDISSLASDSLKNFPKGEDRLTYLHLFTQHGSTADAMNFINKWASKKLVDRYIVVYDSQEGKPKEGQLIDSTLNKVFKPLEEAFKEEIEDNFLKEFDHSKQPDYTFLLPHGFGRLFLSRFKGNDTLLITGREGVGKTFNGMLLGKILKREGYEVYYSSVRSPCLLADSLSDLALSADRESVVILDDCQEDLDKASKMVRYVKRLHDEGKKHPKLIFLSHPLDKADKIETFGKGEALRLEERRVDLLRLAQMFFRKIGKPKQMTDFLDLLHQNDLCKIFFGYRNMRFWNLYFNVVEDSHKVKIDESEFLNFAYGFLEKKKRHLFEFKETLAKLLPFFKNGMPVLKDYANKHLSISEENLQRLESQKIIEREMLDWYDKEWKHNSLLFIRSKIHPTEAKILETIFKKYEEMKIDDETTLVEYADTYYENLHYIITSIQFHDFVTLENLCKDRRFVVIIQNYFKNRPRIGRRIDRVVMTISKVSRESRTRIIDSEVIDKWAERLNSPDFFLHSKALLLRAIFRASPLAARKCYESLDPEILAENFRRIPSVDMAGGLVAFRRFVEVSKNVYLFYLFSTDLVYQNGLANGRVSEGLRRIFENKKYPLSTGVAVEQRADGWWRIVDEGNVYSVRRSRLLDRLDVYYSPDDSCRETLVTNKTRIFLDKCFEEFILRFDKHTFLSQLWRLLEDLEPMKLPEGKGNLAEYFLSKIPPRKIVEWIKIKYTAMYELIYLLKMSEHVDVGVEDGAKKTYYDYLKDSLSYEDIKRVFSHSRSSLYKICMAADEEYEILANYLHHYSNEEDFIQKVSKEPRIDRLNRCIELMEKNRGLSDQQKRDIIIRIIANTKSLETYIVAIERSNRAERYGRQIDIDEEMNRFLDYKEKYHIS